jgi:4-amino-4-deoxy-L-arabinose transferase-like glycosyltransferase
MKKNDISGILKNKYFWIMLAITLVGFFLRVYKHKELLFFEVDQARDWRIVEIARQYGIGELPLLGPGMNASSFRIGPIYHYIQYLSALIFGNTPWALAYPDLFFSILTIPLFYFFLREYFSRIVSAGATLLFSSSLFAIEHGRFAMNSNSLPFFILIIFYALLKLSRENQPKRKWLWVISIAISFGIVVQLHALSLVALPIIIPLYLFITKTKISWKQWAAGILIVVFLISPMVFNESMTGFGSVKSLFSGAGQRKNTAHEMSLAKRLIKNTQEFIRNYTIILFSKEIVISLNNGLKSEGASSFIRKNLHGKTNQANSFLSLIFFILFAIPFWWLVRNYFLKNKERGSGRDFILLIIIWQIFFFLLFAEILYVQHTRYYLPLIFVPFIFLGLYLEKLCEIKKHGRLIVLALIVLFFVFNLLRVKNWFQMVENYSATSWKKNTAREFIQDPYYLATWNQMEAIDNYLEKYYKENQKEIYLMSVDQFYSRSIRYPLIYEKHLPLQIFSNSIRDKDKMYFFIRVTSDSDENNFTLPDAVSSYKNDFEVTGGKAFGTLTILSVKVKDAVLNKPAPPIEVSDPSNKDFKIKKDEPENVHLVQKFTWNQFFKYIKK